MFKKKPPWRSDSFCRFVASKPCTLCNTADGTVVHHHFGGERGIGQKCSDVYVVPLCGKCHATAHSSKFQPFSHEVIVNVWPKVALGLLSEWLASKS